MNHYQMVRETRLSPLIFIFFTFISFVAIFYCHDFSWAFSSSHRRQQFSALNDPPPSLDELKHKKSEERRETMLPFAVGKTPEECDIFSGKWVRDEEDKPLYEESECPYIQPQLTCQEHGRPDKDYQFWRWQPHGCDLPKSIHWGGESDGNCYDETTPVEDLEYNWALHAHESIMKIMDEEFSRSSVPLSFLNITRLSSYRKDAHTQIYKKLWSPPTEDQLANPKSYADCVHWCLPGLQDTWNELLFAKLFYP